MRLRGKSSVDKFKIIRDSIPDGDFIAVFGTSHTSGVCVRGESGEIDRNDIWASLVGEHLGLPVFNASLEGTDNPTMTQMMLDFFELEESSRCKRIINEVRIAEGTFRIGRDLFDSLDTYRRKDFVPQLSNGFDVPKPEFRPEDGDAGGHITIGDKFLSRIPISYNRRKDHIKDQVLNSVIQGDSSMPRDIADAVLSGLVEKMEETIFATMVPFIEDYYQVRTMDQISRMKGIPFNWFCWDTHPYFRDPPDDYRACRNAFKTSTKIFDSEIDYFKKGARYEFQKHWESQGKNFEEVLCDCGHQNEEMHKWISEIIIKELEL